MYGLWSAELFNRTAGPPPSPPHHTHTHRRKVRELLLHKQERLLACLKSLAARAPRELLAAAAGRFADLERRLRGRPGSIEEADALRRLAAGMPAQVAPLIAELEAAEVRSVGQGSGREARPGLGARTGVVAGCMRELRSARSSSERRAAAGPGTAAACAVRVPSHVPPHAARHPRPNAALYAPRQPWYDALEGMRYLLPDDDASSRVSALAWPLRVAAAAERAAEVADFEQAKLADEMGAAQGALKGQVESLAQVTFSGKGRTGRGGAALPGPEMMANGLCQATESPAAPCPSTRSALCAPRPRAPWLAPPTRDTPPTGRRRAAGAERRVEGGRAGC